MLVLNDTADDGSDIFVGAMNAQYTAIAAIDGASLFCTSSRALPGSVALFVVLTVNQSSNDDHDHGNDDDRGDGDALDSRLLFGGSLADGQYSRHA